MISRVMKLTVCLVLLVDAAMALPTPPPGKIWQAVPELTDEFNSWDSSKWWKPLWNYGEPVQMRSANSGVTGGQLWIKATLDSGATRWFETSRVMSHAQISYPMYTECSMRTAHISAYNTFWLNNGDSADRDEFDICENNSNPSIAAQQSYRPYTMYSQYFIVTNSSVERAHGNFDNRNLNVTNALRGVKWNEAYHTLGAWWIDENNIQFYLDGEPAGSVTTVRDFTRDLNVIWDLWTIDATWSGGIAVQSDLLDTNINTMYVDWIHTYQLVDDITLGDPVFADVEVEGNNLIMDITNGTLSGVFDLLSSTTLMTPVESWATEISGLHFDSSGEATVTNPVAGNQEFYRVLDTGTLYYPVTGITVDPAAAVLGVAQTLQLTADVQPVNATDPSVTWSSSAPAVATVDTNGLVTTVALGSATIMATATDGGLADTSAITVANATIAAFDWSDTAGYNKWSMLDYTETDNGVTMTTTSRATTDALQPYAIKFTYDDSPGHDTNPGTITMDVGGASVNFTVTSIDISQTAGTNPGTTKHVRGMLGATVQWEIISPEDGVVRTYATPTTGDMGLEIDTIEWHAGWRDPGSGFGYESTIDNLSITVPTP